MGEYEERYPDAYGRDESGKPVAAEGDRKTANIPPRQTRETMLLRRLLAAAPDRPRDWQHSRAEGPDATPEPEGMPPAANMAEIPIATPPAALHRGRGPRGYVRTSERIREDLCDRLTENPFVDASDIEVSVAGAEVTLEGTVDSDTAYRQTLAIAQEVIGVNHVHNHLTVRLTPNPGPTAGDKVNQILGARRR